MAKPASKTTLYKLIEAGYLARQALLVPLLRNGLEQGDDAILMALEADKGAAILDLSEQTGLPVDMLGSRLQRLERAGVIQKTEIGEELLPATKLTEAGRDVLETIKTHWDELEHALIGELDAKDQKRLRRMLKRFVQELDI